MKENSLTLSSLDMNLCRLTYKIYQTDTRRTKTTHTVSATRSMSLPSYCFKILIIEKNVPTVDSSFLGVILKCRVKIFYKFLTPKPSLSLSIYHVHLVNSTTYVSTYVHTYVRILYQEYTKKHIYITVNPFYSWGAEYYIRYSSYLRTMTGRIYTCYGQYKCPFYFCRMYKYVDVVQNVNRYKIAY